MKLFGLSILFGFVLHFSSANACQVNHESFISKVLTTDPAKPFVVNYLVLLPEGFRADLHYGAVYFLHGRDNSGKMLLDIKACPQLDALVAAKENPFLMIAPDGQNSCWTNAAVTHERYADMLNVELIADVESKYPLISDRSARILAGISMGGRGALENAAKNQDKYAAVGAHSPGIRNQAQATAAFPNQMGTGEEFKSRDPNSLFSTGNVFLKIPAYIDIGGGDKMWLPGAQTCAELIRGFGNPRSEYHIGEDPIGGHGNDYWDPNLPKWLRWYSKILPKPRAQI